MASVWERVGGVVFMRSKQDLKKRGSEPMTHCKLNQTGMFVPAKWLNLTEMKENN